MTDKQIIIDGVDVSGCSHIEYEHKWWNMAGHEQNSENVCHLYFDKNADFEEDFLCQDNPNCYYKQLEKLKAENLGFKILHESDKDLLKRKEQECEELKIYIESNEQQVKEVETLVMDNDRLINELDRLNEDRIDALKQLEFVRTLNTVKEAETIKLHKTLTEIKEIAEINPINTCWTVLELCEKCDENKECDIQCPLFKFKLILQKISEVEE